MPRSPYADFAGAERAVGEACAALLGRHLHGHSSYREVSLAEQASHLAEPLRRGLTAPGGVLGGGNPAYGIYHAREGHVAVACPSPTFCGACWMDWPWTGAARVLDRLFAEELQRNGRNGRWLATSRLRASRYR